MSKFAVVFVFVVVVVCLCNPVDNLSSLNFIKEGVCNRFEKVGPSFSFSDVPCQQSFNDTP